MLSFGQKFSYIWKALLQSCIDNRSNQMLVKGVRLLLQQELLDILENAQCAWERLQSNRNGLFNLLYFFLLN